MICRYESNWNSCAARQFSQHIDCGQWTEKAERIEVREEKKNWVKCHDRRFNHFRPCGDRWSINLTLYLSLSFVSSETAACGDRWTDRYCDFVIIKFRWKMSLPYQLRNGWKWQVCLSFISFVWSNNNSFDAMREWKDDDCWRQTFSHICTCEIELSSAFIENRLPFHFHHDGTHIYVKCAAYGTAQHRIDEFSFFHQFFAAPISSLPLSSLLPPFAWWIVYNKHRRLHFYSYSCLPFRDETIK